jgi:8-oxo-dGTP diphosphatase
MQFIASSDYGDIRLLSYLVRYIQGTVTLNAHSAIAWVNHNELLHYDLAPADIPIAKAYLELGLSG